MRNIIFDWKRTLYDPDTRQLIEGARELLEFLNYKNISMVLIGKGGDDMKQAVERLGIKQFFSDIVFAEGEKDLKTFKKHLSNNDPKDTLIIGDRTRSELRIGDRLDATTIWVKQGKFALELPENREQKLDYTVTSLNDCLKLLRDSFF